MRYGFLLAILCTLASPAAASAPAKPAKPAAQSEIDALFGKLAKAGSPENAKPIEDQIAALFNQSGSPSVDLLMLHAAAAAHAGNSDTAKNIVITITEIAPGFAEGWHQRAALAQSEKNDADALDYLQKTVTLNPREFAACQEIGEILESYGDKKQALQYYRRALALDPYLEGLDKQVQQLSRDVEGEKI
jgi:tetratricopeptide (TPR) repeat protein